MKQHPKFVRSLLLTLGSAALLSPSLAIAPTSRAVIHRASEKVILDPRQVLGTKGKSMNELHTRLERLIVEAMSDGLVPGMSIVVIRNNKVIFSKGYGLANLKTKTAFTPETRGHIGSTGKAFTAVAIMQLVEKGLIKLDAPVTAYLPDFRVGDPRASRITVRHLLTNTSGLGGSENSGGTDADALERQVKSLANVSLEFVPGTGFSYANSGWSVLGLMVQRLSGMSYEDYMRKNIFVPLEMQGSTLEYWKPQALGDTNGYRAGSRTQHVARPPLTNRGYAPAGMQVSSANDLSKYLRMLLNKGVSPSGIRILSEASVKEIMRGQVKAESSVGLENIKYAFGWETLERNGVKAVEHGGSVGTMGSYLMLAPERGFAIGALFNSVDYAKMQLFGNLFNELTGNPTEPYQSFPRPKTISSTGFKAEPANLKRVVGTYAMPRSGKMRVYLKDSRLMIEAHQETDVLEPRAKHSFTVRSELLALEGLEYTFVFTDSGIELHAHTEFGDVEVGTRLETT